MLFLLSQTIQEGLLLHHLHHHHHPCSVIMPPIPPISSTTALTKTRRRRRRRRRSQGRDDREEEQEEQGFCTKPFLAFARSSSSSSSHCSSCHNITTSYHFNNNNNIKLQRACFWLHHDASERLPAKRAAVAWQNYAQSDSYCVLNSQNEASHGRDTKARRRRRIEYLWQKLFSDPSQWWDNRLIKKSTRQPDFKHKSTLEGLWIDGCLTPPWVKDMLATMALGPIQPSGRCSSGVPASFGDYEEVQKFAYEDRLKEALDVLELRVKQNSAAPRAAFVCLLRACTRRKALAEGKHLHALIVQTKCGTDVFLLNLLIEMYSAFGSVSEALKIFTSMPQRNVFSWTAMISTYARCTQSKEAVTLFWQMCQAGIEPDEVVCVVALKACAKIAALEEGQQLHSVILKRGFGSNVIIQNTLVNMYAKCGCFKTAHELFNNMTERSVSSWNAMIAGYAQKGFAKEAIDLYKQMKREDMEPDSITLVLLIKACSSILALHQGKQLHYLILKKGLESDRIIQNTLVDMYAKCGCLKDARKLFDNMANREVISWNAMIAGYAREGLGKEALDLYKQMKGEGMDPSNVTLVLLLKACASSSGLQQGKQLHTLILEKGLESDKIIRNALINMYAKCGRLKCAHKLFDNMAERDVISWNAMIAGYTQEGLGKEALDLYKQMKGEGMDPSNVTLVLLLKACASISALQQGKQLHSLILEKGLGSERIIQNALVDMYAKCGCLKDAHKLFNNMAKRDVISWNAMIAGYAREGLGKEALDLYKQMKGEGMDPSNVTLVLLLKACASISALQQGKQLHSLILEKGLESEGIIQNALVDMYAKCGCLKDAHELFDNMAERDVISWNAMIAGYAQEGLGKEALDLYKQMKGEGLQPNEITFTCVLSACSHSGLVGEGCHVFESMSKVHGVTPTLEHYACMVNLLGRAGSLSYAEDFILKMPIQPDKTVWMSLLGAARKYLNVEIGRRAFERLVELEPENGASYLLLIDMHSATARMGEVAHVRKEMKDKGVKIL